LIDPFLGKRARASKIDLQTDREDLDLSFEHRGSLSAVPASGYTVSSLAAPGKQAHSTQTPRGGRRKCADIARPAKSLVARALVHALRTGRLPSGRRSAWGASAPMNAHAAYGRTRCLGPLEYLCAWHAQTEAPRALTAAQFHTASTAVMDLIACSHEARSLYCEKLLADVDDPIGGALSRNTRHALRSLATAWSEGAEAADASARFLCNLQRSWSDPLAALSAHAPLVSGHAARV